VVFILCLIYVPLTSRARARKRFSECDSGFRKDGYRLTVLDPAQNYLALLLLPGAQPGRGTGGEVARTGQHRSTA
jgi:hypothetical protein